MTDPNRRDFLQQAAGTVAAFAFQPAPAEASRRGPFPGAPLAVALVGAGRQGRAILAELQKVEEVRIAALCDTVASRLASGLRRARGANGFDDHRRMLAEQKDIEAVVVATPTHLHRPVAVDALAARKHVYCEAPLAATVEDARAIVLAARQSGTVFQTGMQARSNPIYGLARSFFRSGSLKDLIALRGQYHRKTSWRFPAADPADERALNWRLDPEVSIGLAGEQGTHQLDVIHWFRGEYPVAVRGSGSVRVYKDGRRVADSVLCDFEFADGVHMSWEATLGNSYGGIYEVLTGSMATIKLAWTAGWMFKEADSPTQGWEVYANRETFFNDEGITLIADATKLAEQGKLKEGVGLPNPPLYYALNDFVTSVAREQTAVCSAEEGLRAAVVGILANEAVVGGKSVAIDPKLFEVG